MSKLVQIGQMFGYWKIIDPVGILYKRTKKFHVLCTRCNKTESYLSIYHLRHTAHCCHECAQKTKDKSYTKANNIGDLSLSNYNRIKSVAKRRDVEFEVSQAYLWDLFCEQRGSCALTGLSIEFGRTFTDWERQTASLDRIDSSKGYIEGNVQWVHKDINVMKGNLSQKSFIDLCRSVYEFSLIKDKNHLSGELNSHMKLIKKEKK